MAEDTELNAAQTYCHAIPAEDGSIDPHQPYMGVIGIAVFKGKPLLKVNILANVYIELRMIQPGVNYPVGILRLRNSTLKEFTGTGKRLFTIFNTRGSDLKYSDHFGKGFVKNYLNQAVIEKMLERIPAPTEQVKNPYHRVLFTVDTSGKTHKLDYERYEKELTENAEHAAFESANEHAAEGTSAGEDLLANAEAF